LRHVATHLKGMYGASEQAERHAVANGIGDQSTAIFFLEAVGMMPERKGSGKLHVRKTMGRMPAANLRGPAERNAAQTQTVANQSARLDLRCADASHTETQPRRSDFLQISGVGKERKNLGEWPVDPLLAAKSVEPCQNPILRRRIGFQRSGRHLYEHPSP